MAVLAAKKEMGANDTLVARSVIGSEFSGKIRERFKLGELDAILPTITGRAWITGTHQLMLDPTDPWPEGYRVGDTWPGA